MSTAVLLTLLLLAELALLACGAAIYLFLRLRRLGQLAQPEAETSEKTSADDEAIDGEAARSFLRLAIDQSREHLREAQAIEGDPDARLRADALRKRVEYLEAEVGFLQRDDVSDTYWNRVVQRVIEMFELRRADYARAPGEDGLTALRSNFTALRTGVEGYIGHTNTLVSALPKDPENGTHPPELQVQLNELGDRETEVRRHLSDFALPDSPAAVRRLFGLAEEPEDSKTMDTAALDSKRDELMRLREIIDNQHQTIRKLQGSLTDPAPDGQAAKPLDEATALPLNDIFEELELPQSTPPAHSP